MAAAAAKQEWLIIIPDHAGALEQRMKVRPQHLEAIKPNVASGTVTMGGATLEEHPAEGQPMKINGSAMLVQASSREEALKVVEGDVYTKSGVWDTGKMQVLPFKSAVRQAL